MLDVRVPWISRENAMNVLIMNAHLTYPGLSEGRLNMTFMEVAKAFFNERGHDSAETMVQRGYDPSEEVAKQAAADLMILQTPINQSILYAGKGTADLFLAITSN